MTINNGVEMTFRGTKRKYPALRGIHLKRGIKQ